MGHFNAASDTFGQSGLEHFETVWHTLGHKGTLWDALGHTGTIYYASLLVNFFWKFGATFWAKTQKIVKKFSKNLKSVN